MALTIKLGSRGSPPAMAQSHLVRDMLAKATGQDAGFFPLKASPQPVTA
jgi:porphobilinogen deaminase